MIIELNVNNKKHALSIECDTTLYSVLRDLGYKSVKCGCSTSNCGLCTVWIDEVPVLSCSVLAIRCGGKKITTLEGISQAQRKFGELLSEEGGEQCGFCSPGFIMNVISLKKTIKNPTEDEINDYLMGNLCRCTGYASQMRAIKKYLEIEDEDK
ncbi:(2Fe-2S)-binding protein [uncultured Finegoldia sp.]|uniref:(2Fe-2S)-binding protein n=1 Tax=uncultured Finegoldia sp. TaxID=328009 RepID=UPI002637CD8C|nr:2Fe-2S iron-sulfur cluster-binding protein [uncultured Finegoldia sp.]